MTTLAIPTTPSVPVADLSPFLKAPPLKTPPPKTPPPDEEDVNQHIDRYGIGFG